jgi:hypothetical protein
MLGKLACHAGPTLARRLGCWRLGVRLLPARGRSDKAARAAVELVRELIDRIVVTPTDDGEPMKLELVGNVAALLEEQPRNGGAILAVAGPRNHFCYNSLSISI